MHGMAAVNDAVFNLLADRKPIVINLSSNLIGKSWLGYLTKAMRALIGCLRILVLPLRREKTFYSSVDDGLGSLLSALLTLMARLRHCRIILHHHSYKYLARSVWNMRLLVRVAGRGATHVFLCDRMESAFRALYPRPFNALICPNPVTDPVLIAHFSKPPDPTPQPILTIGFLSNLMFEKGIGEFIDVIRQAPAQGIELRGVMAGSAFKPEVQAFLDDAKQELGERLELLGAVHGARKVAFFESIDVLIFPTRYPTEAFSLVLMEGLLAGCPLIAYGRGCIPILSHLDTARVLPPEVDFPTTALPLLEEWARTRDGLSTLKAQAHQDGVAIHRRHLDARDTLIKAIRLSGDATLTRPQPVNI
ncbi:glycosyl transferase family 1 [Thiobaca trueperi]|uniref:Glycosyl transferase family 1 n=2 Tax=Thiobaca trueperi TaxID=127458 RepID=A0A4R3MTA8_9GAMM|nr:glycosyl transferase family 1 [Thiobaca trueperi]